MQTNRKTVIDRLRLLGLPLSLIYFILTFVRNKFYDWNWCASSEYNVPVIGVGNITVGGTGKTPHTEYLIRLLRKRYNVGVLSRGYKRKTKGYILADKMDTASRTGDEPLQMKKKFPDILVAVCEDRRIGIKKLISLGADVIILDDAFQHRRVSPDFNILLCNYNRPVFKDFLMPAGNLRESRLGKARADAMIVAKCPDNLDATVLSYFTRKLSPKKHQHLFFSKIKYGNPAPIYTSDLIPDKSFSVLLITGIANPAPLLDYCRKEFSKVAHIQYADHHAFNQNNKKEILRKFDNLSENRKIILTTEKDAVRLLDLKKWKYDILNALFYLPIEIDFFGDEDRLNDLILKVCRKKLKK